MASNITSEQREELVRQITGLSGMSGLKEGLDDFLDKADGASNAATTGITVANAAIATGLTINNATATNIAQILTVAEDLGTPAAASTTAIHAAFAGNDASLNFPGPITNPDVPRNLTVTFAAGWDGGDVNVVGEDNAGNPINETFASGPGTTVKGNIPFSVVTSATKGAVGAAADAASIGTGDRLGLAVLPSLPVGSLTVDRVNVLATWGDTYATVAPPGANAPDGARLFTAMYPRSVTIAQNAHNHATTEANHTHVATVTDGGHSHT